MKTKAAIGLLVGLSAVILLVVWQGLETVAGLLAEAGWGLLLVCLFAPFDQWLGAEAWRRLFPPHRRPGTVQTWMASWMGSAVNTLLPVATIGGEVVKARVVMLWSYSGTDAFSTMVVDKTVQAIVILVWAMVGIAMLTVLVSADEIVTGAIIGAVALALGIAGFVAAQVLGSVSFFARIVNRMTGAGKWEGLVDNASGMDAALKAIYRRPWTIVGSCALRLAGRFWLVGEVLLAAHLMGHPIGLAEAVLIKSLVVGLRGVAFAVPGGLGVQEGAYIAFGALVGLPADLMLAVSLTTRVRDIVPSIPFLFAWQHTEGRALWRRAAADSETRL